MLLTKTIEAGRASGAVADRSLERVSVDTTVMEKNIAHPTDARLYEKARQKLVALAAEGRGRAAPELCAPGRRGWRRRPARYAHARQFKRMRKALRTLKGYTGRVMRDLRRRLEDIPPGPLRERILDMLVLTSRLLHQKPKDSGKIYSLHEPEVDCISKGKAAGALRVRHQGQPRRHHRRGLHRRHAGAAGQPLRRPHARRGSRTGRGADRPPSVSRHRRPRLSRARPSRPPAC